MADKTAGDYGVEIEETLKNNSLEGVPPIIAEMRAAAPPGEPPPSEPPAPVDLGLAGFADELDKAVAEMNVAQVRQISEDMKAVAPPTTTPA